MTLWHISWGYLWNRKLTTSLTVLSVALAVALISSVLTLRAETEERFVRESQAFDAVIGAKGSPLQLVLSTVYMMDQPVGNISVEQYKELLADDPSVQAAFPMNLGDTYKGFRLVGVERKMMDHSWTDMEGGDERKPFTLDDGRYFEKSFEAVLGAMAARQTGLEIGQDFISTHGLIPVPEGFEMEGHDHSANPYTVVGILEPSNSPFDRGIYCSLASVWEAHAGGHGTHDVHHGDHGAQGDHEAQDAHEAHADDEAQDVHEAAYEEWGLHPEEMVTAVLVQLESPTQRFEFEAYVNNSPMGLMAAIPINQIRNLYDKVLGWVKLVLLAVGYLVVVISALSILIGLYLSILQRRRDLAVMRALGASAYEIFGVVLIEAFWVTLLGIGCGWLAGVAATYVLGEFLTYRFGLVVNAFRLSQDQIAAFFIVWIIGIFAGFLPAWQAYDRDVARDLADL